MLEDISLLLPFEFSEYPGDEGPLLDIKLEDPLQPIPKKNFIRNTSKIPNWKYLATFSVCPNLLLPGDCNLNDWDFVDAKPHTGKPEPFVGVGNGVDGCLGGVEEGVLKRGAAVILSRNVSICFKDRALCRVSKGLIGGTPPKPSIAGMHSKNFRWQITVMSN